MEHRGGCDCVVGRWCASAHPTLLVGRRCASAHRTSLVGRRYASAHRTSLVGRWCASAHPTLLNRCVRNRTHCSRSIAWQFSDRDKDRRHGPVSVRCAVHGRWGTVAKAVIWVWVGGVDGSCGADRQDWADSSRGVGVVDTSSLRAERDSLRAPVATAGSAIRPHGNITNIAAVSPAPEPARGRAIVPLLPYQRMDVESDERFRWNCWARQTGKSFTTDVHPLNT